MLVMTRTGFKPEWGAFHDERAKEFQTRVEKGGRDAALDHAAFVKWTYGVEQ